jgi:hypothetical protein
MKVWRVFILNMRLHHDTFLGDSPKEVHKQGMCIDGRTGKIVKDVPR